MAKIDNLNPPGFVDSISAELVLEKANVAYKCPTTDRTNKKLFVIHNKSNITIYYGGYNVTAGNGIPIFKEETITLRVSASIYLVSPTAGKKVNIWILELGRYD